MTGIIDRIGQWTIFLTLLTSVLWVAFGDWPRALSVFLGGSTSWFGYRTHVQIVDRAIYHAKKRWLKSKIVLRYGLIIVAIYVIIRTSYLDVAGFFIGLLFPAAAVMIESVRFLIRNLRGM